MCLGANALLVYFSHSLLDVAVNRRIRGESKATISVSSTRISLVEPPFDKILILTPLCAFLILAPYAVARVDRIQKPFRLEDVAQH